MRRTRAQTKQLQQSFLEQYPRLPSIALCARAVGIHRNTVAYWRERDHAFAEAFEQAEQEALEALELEARRRVLQGVTTTRRVFNAAGEPLGHQEVTRYSDSLLLALLKAHHPRKYRERPSPHALDDRPVLPLAALRAAVAAARKRSKNS